MRNKKTKKVNSFQLINSNQSFKLLPLTGRSRSKMFLNCQPMKAFCQKNRDTILVCLLVLSLLLILSGYNPGCQQKTFFQANQQFLDDYATFLADSYGGMVNQTLMAWGEVVYPLKNVKVVLKDTTEAYAAMLLPIAQLFAKVFVGSAKVLAVVSYAISTPARVLAMVGQ